MSNIKVSDPVDQFMQAQTNEGMIADLDLPLVANTAWIMANGNNDTAVLGNRELPYAPNGIAAALTAGATTLDIGPGVAASLAVTTTTSLRVHGHGAEVSSLAITGTADVTINGNGEGMISVSVNLSGTNGGNAVNQGDGGSNGTAANSATINDATVTSCWLIGGSGGNGVGGGTQQQGGQGGLSSSGGNLTAKRCVLADVRLDGGNGGSGADGGSAYDDGNGTPMDGPGGGNGHTGGNAGTFNAFYCQIAYFSGAGGNGGSAGNGGSGVNGGNQGSGGGTGDPGSPSVGALTLCTLPGVFNPSNYSIAINGSY